MTAPAPLAPLDSAAKARALDAAVAAVRAAGDELLRLADAPLEVLGDFAHDVKLAADRRAEAAILGVLEREFPLPVLTEETGEHGAVTPLSRMWVVDPLDGTFNYSRHLPLCCSSVGLWENGEPVLGAILNFFTGELFTGIVGEGAKLDGKPVSASSVELPAQAALATGFPHHADHSPDALAAFVARVRAFKKIRMLGSAALMGAYTACGWLDAYEEDDIWLWDVAAAAAIARAAGAVVTVRPGSAGPWAREVVFAATPPLAAALAK